MILQNMSTDAACDHLYGWNMAVGKPNQLMELFFPKRLGEYDLKMWMSIICKIYVLAGYTTVYVSIIIP